MTKTRTWLLVLIVVGIPCLFCAGWMAAYGGYYDPKSPAYLLWKHDLWTIDKDRALSIMTHAQYPDRLVVGKARSEIEKRLGPLIPLSEASPYVQSCTASELAAGNSMMLRKSEWMVTFSGNRAIELILVKGC